MKKIFEMVRMDDITTGCWKKLCERLYMEIKFSKRGDRYRKRGLKGKTFIPSEKGSFAGIINYLREESVIENCSYLNGNRLVHTFKIGNELSGQFRFFRIRQSGMAQIKNFSVV